MTAVLQPTQRGEETLDGAALRAITVVLPLLLVGYAFGDRGFAWIHAPGTPFFVGEAVLAVGLAAVMSSTLVFRRAWAHRPVLIPLVAFCAWGAFLSALGFAAYGLDAVQDSAVWYYAVVAFLVIGILADQPRRLHQWIHVYVQVLPFLLAWSAVALLSARSKVPGPLVPDSAVPLLAHKPGNVAVQASIALGVLWLVPLPEVSSRRRMVLSTAAIVLAGLAGTQSRGGFLAAALAGAVAFALHRGRARQVTGTAVVLMLLIGGAWALNLRIVPQSDREISVDQLFKNVSTVLSRDSASDDPLVGTVEFREQLWDRILSKMNREGAFEIGLGFGPNLAAAVGVAGEGSLDDPDLRSPHNSHLNVLARMGVVGTVLFGAVWVGWSAAVLAARSRHWRMGWQFESGVCSAAVVAVVAILCNAFFDPTLEGAQVAMWLWAIFGIGAVVVPRGSLAFSRPSRP